MIVSASVVGTNLSFSWPTNYLGCRLVVQTNHLENGLSANSNDWATVPGSPGTNQMMVPIDPSMKLEFYRLANP